MSMLRDEVADDIDYSVERKRHGFPDLFFQKGGFSLHDDNPSVQSEIPLNTIEIHPHNALFRKRQGCRCDCDCSDGCCTCLRRNIKYSFRVIAGITSLLMVGLLIGSITFHIIRIHNVKEKEKEDESPDKYRFSVHFHLLNNSKDETTADNVDDELFTIPTETNFYDERPKIVIIEDSRTFYDDLSPPRIKALIAKHRHLLNFAKRRLRRNIGGTYKDQQYNKSQCVGESCDEMIGSSQDKLTEILMHLREVKAMLLKYEKKLKQQPHLVFRDFSLTYPTEANEKVDDIFDTILGYRDKVKNGNFTYATVVPVTTESSNVSSIEGSSEQSNQNTLSRGNVEDVDYTTTQKEPIPSSENNIATIERTTTKTGSTKSVEEITTTVTVDDVQNTEHIGNVATVLRNNTKENSADNHVEANFHPSSDKSVDQNVMATKTSTDSTLNNINKTIIPTANSNNLSDIEGRNFATELTSETTDSTPTNFGKAAITESDLNTFVSTEERNIATELTSETTDSTPTNFGKAAITESDSNTFVSTEERNIATELTSETTDTTPTNFDITATTETDSHVFASIDKKNLTAELVLETTDSSVSDDLKESTKEADFSGSSEKNQFTEETGSSTSLVVEDVTLSYTFTTNSYDDYTKVSTKESTFSGKFSNELSNDRSIVDVTEEDVPQAKSANEPAIFEGISLQELKSRKMIQNNGVKWESRVVSSPAQVSEPTGPDAVIGVGEAIKTSQQLSLAPSAFSPSSIPFIVCFYSATHSVKDYPTIRAQERTFGYHPNLYETLNIGGNTPVTSPPPAQQLKITQPASQQATFNFYMNSNPPLFEKQINNHPNIGQPLFCTHLQPPVYQFPTVPGTLEYSQSRCENCDNFTMTSDEPSRNMDDLHSKPNACSNDGSSVSCMDGSMCIPAHRWCDNKVHCNDASDELHCSCTGRINKHKYCDGILDCPHGEDEQNCSECPLSTFSCHTSDENPCIPLQRRCDGKIDCSSRNDETGCSLLSPEYSTLPLHVSYVEGFLHRNVHGVWYAVCNEIDGLTWAHEACSNEAPETDLSDMETSYKLIPPHIKGPFLKWNNEHSYSLVGHCTGNSALYVKCPPLKCGKRDEQKEESPEITEFVARFRRFIEGDGLTKPTSIEDKAMLLHVQNLTEEVKKRFHVSDVVARIEEIDGQNRLKRQDERVVGGKSSALKAWPWAAALYKDGNFHCGAVLLDDTWVLTAAHCVSKYWYHYYEVRLGMLRRFSFSPMEQVRKIVQVQMHEKYDATTMKNDIAVLKMSHLVGFNRWIRPPCLPLRVSNAREGIWPPTPRSKCVAVGWGAIKEHGIDPDQLREVEVPILRSCKRLDDINGNEICAGYKEGGKDTCQGDSGGPLMCQEMADSWYVAGIVSHGEGCARPGEPGAYTRVSLYIDWLTSVTADIIPKKVFPQPHCPGFQCSSHPGRCLAMSAKCNGLVECLNAEDESDCPHQRTDEIEDADQDHPTAVAFRSLESEILNYSKPNTSCITYSCKNLIQAISCRRLCDGIEDCLDGSDEDNCNCYNHLRSSNPDSICDGIQDCDDASDERNCYSCPKDFFHCHTSRLCVSLWKKCDHVNDCEYGEDEQDCLALVENMTLSLDATGRPKFNNRGVLVRNSQGVWSAVCQDERDRKRSKTAISACQYIGSITSESYKNVYYSDLKLSYEDNSHGYLSATRVENAVNCSAVEVVCSPRTNIVEKRYTPNDKKWYWSAEVFFDGIYVCSGVLLTEEWIVVSSKCLGDERYQSSFITVQLGRQNSYKSISHIKRLSPSVLLLLLSNPAETSRSVRPIQSPVPDFQKSLSCVAVWRNKSVKLQRDEDAPDCGFGNVCYRRVRRPPRGCTSIIAWIGFVICESPIFGWTLDAVFHEPAGECGFQHARFVAAADVLVPRNATLIDKSKLERLQPAACRGLRCSNGLCISNPQLCDGIANCPDREDESKDICSKQTGCQIGEYSCNNQCFPMQNISNAILQCVNDLSGKHSVTVSTCKSYLKMKKPQYICDGERNCLGKDDEIDCPCTNTSFSCKSGNKCIPMGFVCDGMEDCTDGTDEQECLALMPTSRKKEFEYKMMSYGEWHTKCNTSLPIGMADKLCREKKYKKAVSLNQRKTKGVVTEPGEFSLVKLSKLISFNVRPSRKFITFKENKKPCFATFVKCS